MRFARRLTIITIGASIAVLTHAEVRRYDGPGPVEIHVYAKVKSDHGPVLKKAFRDHFYPAISKQEGFLHCDLLQSPNEAEAYVITIAFASEELRVTWANSPVHQDVWPKIQGTLEQKSMSIRVFSLVSPT